MDRRREAISRVSNSRRYSQRLGQAAKGARKKKRGRKKGTGVLSGINRKRESWTEIRNRVIHDSAEWRLVRLRQLIEQEKAEQAKMISDSKLADNYLSARKAEIAAKKRYVLQGEIDALWRDLSAQFESAVLDGDAGWFERQAKALGSVQQQEHARFNAAVVHAIESAMWALRAHQKGKRESATLTPTGKSVGKTAHDIFEVLNAKAIDGRPIVEGRSFESKGRAGSNSRHCPATRCHAEKNPEVSSERIPSFRFLNAE